MIARLALVLMLIAAPCLVSANEKPKAPSGGAGRYLVFNGVTATIFRTSQRRGVLALDASLDVPDEALRARAASLNPRLRAAYAQSLTIYAAGIPAGRPLDPDYLSREMQRQTDMVLGKPGAKFLIGSILIN